MDTRALEQMLDRLAHRGPDDRGILSMNGSWLGHRRLSIVDVAGGSQPLSNEAGDLFLVGNGEVYNHERLRSSLSGWSFSTDSDNEVALALLDIGDPGSLGEMNGMFAFVAAGEDGSFVAARDQIGIKPLYWARRGETVLFASEMHTFPEDWRPLVEPLPPGCAWTPQGGLVRFAETAPVAPTIPQDRDAILEGTRDVLVRAVERQLMGDVRVGVFLSGGLDSSLIAAIAARRLARRGEKLMTFAVGLEGSSDLAAARKVAELLGTDHRETTYTAEEAIEALPGVVRCIESFDPGLVRSAVPNFMLSELAARHLKVVLTGEGADELFAGYDYMRAFSRPDALHEELVRTLRSLHNLNLQRCDRVTMAHSLEARVPFLDREVIRWALAVPAELKLAPPGTPEKQLLREAFTGWLPDEFLWRDKEEFGDGSGARDALSAAVEAGISDAEFAAERDLVSPPLRTKEELAYHRIFREHLAGIRPEATISRFARA